MSHIEVITFNQRGRRYTAEQKPQFVALSIQAGSSVSAVAWEYGIAPSLLFSCLNGKTHVTRGHLCRANQ